MNFKNHSIGAFDVVSSEITIGDPCYEKDDRAVLKVKAKNGTWNAEILTDFDTFCGTIVHKLIAKTETAPSACGSSQLLPVDSGQMSIFDSREFKGGEDNTWYRDVCDRHFSSGFAACLLAGCVCTSGAGDGSYMATVEYDDTGLAIRIEVDFWGEDEE